jgi:hypothetical protein
MIRVTVGKLRPRLLAITDRAMGPLHLTSSSTAKRLMLRMS